MSFGVLLGNCSYSTTTISKTLYMYNRYITGTALSLYIWMRKTSKWFWCSEWRSEPTLNPNRPESFKIFTRNCFFLESITSQHNPKHMLTLTNSEYLSCIAFHSIYKTEDIIYHILFPLKYMYVHKKSSKL